MEQEESQKESKPLKKRWPLLFWTGAFFCFVFFPIFLLDIGLESYVNTKSTIEENEAYRKLGLKLERLLQYGNSRHYYHSLLKKIFDIAESQKDPIAYLKRAIPHLKSRNPGVFNFIVWENNSGDTIDELTDEKGHKYVVKVLLEVFRAITADYNRNYPGNPALNDVVEKRINLIRSYIGNFFVAECLNSPLLRANLGEVVPVTTKEDKAYFWFQSGKKVTLMVTLSGAAINSISYLAKLVNGMNKVSDDGIKYGIIDMVNGNDVIPENDEKIVGELKVGLSKFENYSSQKLYTDNYILLAKILNSYVRGFCYIKRDDVYSHANLRKNTLILACAAILLFCISLWGFYRFTDYMFSMRWKLTLFFIYANGLPLLTLGFIGYDYMQQSRSLLLEEAYENVSTLLNDFDSKFELITDEYASKFNQLIERINSNTSETLDLEKKYESLTREVKKSSYTDYAIIGFDGTFSPGGSKKLNDMLLKSMGVNLLKFVNNTAFTPKKAFVKDSNEKEDFSGVFSDVIFFHQVLQRAKKIHYEQVLDEANYYYWNFIGNPNDRKYESIVAVSWSVQQLQENYTQKYINSLNENMSGIKCMAFSEKYGKIYPESSRVDSSIYGTFRQILNLRSLNFNDFVFEGKHYAAYGTVGRNLNQVALLGFYPLDSINNEIGLLWIRFILFIVTSLILSGGISWVLSAYFLAPIKDIQSGVEAMGRQNFKHRLEVRSADEFGQLNTAFNSAIESLEDLAVATTVQENLFPLEPMTQNGTLVWGKSVTMTRLGGDYFDFFPLNDSEIGVLMGDVAGHGVPAGFLMAMAKASVLLSDNDRFSPAALLTNIHKVFYHVKSKKIKRMMTCIYFWINTETGQYKVANAGHCYPAIINKSGEVKFLEMDGTPLGITKRARFSDSEGTLDDGDYLLLYTDGMIEAHNLQGESMGMERLTKLISESYSEEPDEYYKKIFAGYKNWAPLADDDITMVLVRYRAKQAGEQHE